MRFSIFVSVLLTSLSFSVAAPIDVAIDEASADAGVKPVRGPHMRHSLDLPEVENSRCLLFLHFLHLIHLGLSLFWSNFVNGTVANTLPGLRNHLLKCMIQWTPDINDGSLGVVKSKPSRLEVVPSWFC